MSVGHNSEVTDKPDDMDPIMSLLAADEEICEAIMTVDREILALVRQLGGSEKSYRRKGPSRRSSSCPRSTVRRGSPEH